ncbi:MAG: ATPase [Planctomycetota bacterium]|nr:MAG: ATPase [Planctomycetota bacterium]
MNASGSARPWFLLEGDELSSALECSPQGLSEEQARQRLEHDGPNELPAESSGGPLRLLVAQFRDLMIMVLLGAALVSAVVGEAQDAAVILMIVGLNALIGAFQEWRAERAVQALRELATPHARVRRDGTWRVLPASEVVVGDRLRVEAGDVVTADTRLLRTVELAVDEAALTGESEPVSKSPEVLHDAALAVGDRSNLAHRGTLVVRGHGEGLVVATGSSTELGRVAELLGRQTRARTPLQRRLGTFGRQVAWAVLAVCALVFVAGVLRGESASLMLLTAVSLGVAAIPEALPAVASVALALGARRMIRRRTLVRRLPAVEALGSVTYACADKTGTLTEGRMRVEGVQLDAGSLVALPPWSAEPAREPERETLRWLGMAMALVNDVDASNLTGDPTELALFEASRDAGYERAELERDFPRVGDVPFDARRRRMSTVHRTAAHDAPHDGPRHVVLVKGAPEAVLPLCVNCDAAEISQQADALAGQGLRVLAIARRELDSLPAQLSEQSLEQKLEFLGLVALLDPPRAGAADSIAQCRLAGITPVMITGDHPATARAIAQRIGLFQAGDEVVTGGELETLNDTQLEARIERIRVFARASPEQKIRIVRALQARGEFVAMTGDGVNDAPALKSAEIGVAMGRGGTDVAREAADMVLLDDDFGTIMEAVREGRRAFDNVRKFIKYAMTGNTGEIWTLLIAPFLGLPLPLLPIQILWINIVTDGLPGLALGAEPEERGVMQRPPRRPDESLFANGLGLHVIWCGVLIGCFSIGVQAWAWHAGSAAWQTMAFTVLTLCQLAHVLAIRSERESCWQRGVFTNPPLLAAVLLSVVLQLGVVYVPALQDLFHTQALSGLELLVCFGVASLVFLAVELQKSWQRGRARA